MHLGYTMMTEQAGPTDLVDHVVAAEAAGFDFAVCSDHFFPWLEEMGHSPHAWTTLGAAAQATSRIDLMTSVTGVSFDEAWDDRAPGDLDGLPVNFIGRSSLLRNKDATGRPKDRIDAEELRKQKPN